MFRLLDSVMLTERDGFGTQLVERIKAKFAAGPKVLAEDEYQARLVWMEKMLDRVRVGDVEGNYRRHWLLTSLLEDYFVLRGEWYRGPKESFRELRHHEPELYDSFTQALAPSATFRRLRHWCRRCVVGLWASG